MRCSTKRGAPPCPPGGSMTYGSSTLDWLSHYRGGWQVMFPNAGAECTVDGVAHPVHGDVSSAPAEVLDLSASHVVMRSATRLPLRMDRRISLAGGSCRPDRRRADRERVDGDAGLRLGSPHRARGVARDGASTCLSGRSTSMMGSMTRTPTSLQAPWACGPRSPCGTVVPRPSIASPRRLSSACATSRTDRRVGLPCATSQTVRASVSPGTLTCFPTSGCGSR